jgi:GT2 family glycosyltransferase
LVSLIIPTGGNTDLLRKRLSGILDATDYQPIEVIILQNHDTKTRVVPFFDEISRDPRVSIVAIPSGFNLSRICNLGVSRAKGDILGLINDDIEVVEPGWLEEMVSHALRPGVGAVGALLYYPDGRIQHAGVVTTSGGVAWHAHHGLPRGDYGYFGRASVAQDVSAVTGACMVMPKAVFDQVGGFNEKDLGMAYNDVDLCLRIREDGYRIVWTPYAELYRHQSASRDPNTDPDKVDRFKAETRYMRERWGHILDRDPYYNPNLGLNGAAFGLAFPPRVEKPWRSVRSDQSLREGPAAHIGAGISDLFELRGLKPRGRIAVVLHLYYPDLWDEVRQAIERISEPFDLFVSLTTGASEHMRDAVMQAFPNAYVSVFENRGRDIRPFLAFVQSGALFRYELVCKLHTKVSPHIREIDGWRYPDGDAWRRALIDGVIGSSCGIDRIVSSFRSDPGLGMVVCDGNIYNDWASNEKLLGELLPHVGISPNVRDRSFPGGSIFWIRSSLLRTLDRAGIRLDDFEPEPIPADGALCHAVERMFGLICEDTGMRIAESGQLAEASQKQALGCKMSPRQTSGSVGSR